MRNLFKKGLSIIGISALVLAACGGAQETNQQAEPAAGSGATNQEVALTIGETPWTSTVPPTYVAKHLLEEMGYKVSVQKADAGVVYTGLSKGDIDIFMDAWLPDMHKNYMEKYGDTLVDTAISYPDGELGWVVPTYMEDINSIDDLVGKEDLFNGTIYGIEEGAGITETSRKMIEGYDLKLEYAASSEPGMLTQAKRLMDKKEPVLFVGWRPHPMFVDFDLKVLPDSKGFFEASEVHVITNKGLQEKAPEAFAFLSKWSMPVGDIEEMIVKIEGGATPEEVAKEWVEANPDRVKEMKGE
ncbi:glycine betaine ABC transporter substrate-binding protein [Ammoniphilus sp. YIM 78166]|uniref:glycine betaine ABC transporter substrate-binding protein n=1 Tax=Ammoniphilus sp. YIM 78166 TaxID=1644106 RepID=UPI001F112308|nr:glycine betaine ABC transporter substrate-binding protein [Ammoniphilus sp. YIM 78166]